MNINPGQFPTYKSLPPVLRTQTTYTITTGNLTMPNGEQTISGREFKVV
jgi:hypothetical protein